MFHTCIASVTHWPYVIDSNSMRDRRVNTGISVTTVRRLFLVQEVWNRGFTSLVDCAGLRCTSSMVLATRIKREVKVKSVGRECESDSCNSQMNLFSKVPIFFRKIKIRSDAKFFS